MPSPLSLLKWLDKARSLATEEAVPRIERIVKDLPHTAEVYSPQAIAHAAHPEVSKQIVPLNPREFLSLAYPLPRSQAAPYVEHLQEMAKQGRFVDPRDGLYMENYIKNSRSNPYEGFSDLPFLQTILDPSSSFRAQVTGHEGRHRNMALESLYPEDLEWPVSFRSPGLPKRPRFVYPEWPTTSFSLDLSDRPKYADGGLLRTVGKGALDLLRSIKKPKDVDARIVRDGLLSDDYPITVLSQDSRPVAAYSLSPREDHTYLPHILSLEPGQGHGARALEDAYQNSPVKPVRLYSIPGAVDFYRKQPGWVESVEDGVTFFERKAQGGLCQMASQSRPKRD